MKMKLIHVNKTRVKIDLIKKIGRKFHAVYNIFKQTYSILNFPLGLLIILVLSRHNNKKLKLVNDNKMHLVCFLDVQVYRLKLRFLKIALDFFLPAFKAFTVAENTKFTNLVQNMYIGRFSQ